MSKEKTIPDPPVHIKNWIMDEWNVVDSVSEHEISGSQGFRLGASIMYKKNQEELEERSVGFLDWALTDNLLFKYEDGCFYWEEDKDGDMPISNEHLYKMYFKSLSLTQNKDV